jgi:hypothetical protein
MEISDMRKLSFSLVISLLLGVSAYAAPVMVLGTLTGVTNTTILSTTNLALQYNPAYQQFTLTHGALSATNVVYFTIQSSTDGVNFVTNSIWYPTTNGAATEVINANTIPITNYFRIGVTATSAGATVNGSYGQ